MKGKNKISGEGEEDEESPQLAVRVGTMLGQFSYSSKFLLLAFLAKKNTMKGIIRSFNSELML